MYYDALFICSDFVYFDGKKAGDPYRIGTVMAIRQVSLSVSEYRARTG